MNSDAQCRSSNESLVPIKNSPLNQGPVEKMIVLSQDYASAEDQPLCLIPIKDLSTWSKLTPDSIPEKTFISRLHSYREKTKNNHSYKDASIIKDNCT